MAGDGRDGRMYVLLLFINVFMRSALIQRRSLNRLFSSQPIDSHTAEFCLLRVGWRSIYIVIRKRTVASDHLRERPLVQASFLESSIPGPSPTSITLHSGMGSFAIRVANLVEKILLAEATVDFERLEIYVDHVRKRDRLSDRSQEEYRSGEVS